MSVGGQTVSARLGDITEIVMGQAPPGADCNRQGRGTPFVKAGEFKGYRPVIREWTTNRAKGSQVRRRACLSSLELPQARSTNLR